MLAFMERLRFGKHLLSLIHDPRNTDDVFALSEIGRHSRDQEPGRKVIEHALRDPGYRKLAERRYLPRQPELKDLIQLPDDTLGHAYATHMTANGLDPNFFPVIDIDTDMGYYSMRLRSTHDLWHVVTGYDTSVEGEIALQALMVAQTLSPVSAAICAAGTLHVLKSRPSDANRIIAAIADGYTRGMSSQFLAGVAWEDHWETPLATLQSELGLPSGRLRQTS